MWIERNNQENLCNQQDLIIIMLRVCVCMCVCVRGVWITKIIPVMNNNAIYRWSMNLSPSIYQSLSLYLSISLHLSLSLSIYLFLSMSFPLSFSLPFSLNLFHSLSLFLSIYLSIFIFKRQFSIILSSTFSLSLQALSHVFHFYSLTNYYFHILSFHPSSLPSF